MSEISEFEKIHSYVTWPDREREVFPNGNVTIGALGFPVANASGVANDGTCACIDENATCKMPNKLETEFSTSHGSGTVPSSISFTATTPVDISYDGGLHLELPVSDISYNHSTHVLEVTLFDEVSSGSCTLVKSGCTDDLLKSVHIISTQPLNMADEPKKLRTDVISENDILLSNLSEDCSERSLFAVSLPLTDGQYVSLTSQKNKSENGIYQNVDGTLTYVMAVPAADTEADYDEVVSDPTLFDNVGTCDCDHFRKTYSDREVHDYVYDKLGSMTKFGVAASVTGCQGAFINWLVSTGKVDIGNQHGYPVFVNGFGLGSIAGNYGLAHPTVENTASDEPEEEIETLHPWLLWSYGTTKDERTETNVSCLPRDWPFTYDSTAYASRTDTSNVTLVKKGVTLQNYAGSETFGNLYADIMDETDPTKVVAHRFYNRHHFVINQKYLQESDGGYELKPFFIHLPAPLDTEDGETYEITVSIQNQKVTAPWFSSEKDIASYYAAMSQPRVFVMGGRQQFSNKKMPITSIEESANDTYTVTTSKPAVDAFGELLDVDTEVRANIIALLNGESLPSITGFGTLTANTESGATIVFEGKKPSDRRYYNELTSMFICGMAYLGEDDNPSDTRMGLVRDDDMLRGDSGSGVSGTLDEINNFYSIDEKEDHRSLPHVDRRYLLATVYQTATNTFPWSMTNRRKLPRLDRWGSDVSARLKTEDSDTKNIVYKVYEANLHFIGDDEFEPFTMTTSSSSSYYNIRPNESPVSYGYNATALSWQNLASVLQVALPRSIKPTDASLAKPVVEAYGNPVRQACLAIKNFTNDLYNMRLVRYSGSSDSEVKPYYYSIANKDEWPSPNTTLIGTSDLEYSDVEDGGLNDTIRRNVMWSNMRSLPKYVYDAETYDQTSELFAKDSSVLFNHADGSLHYAETTPYNKFSSAYASTDSTGEDDCGLLGNSNTGRVFSENSVIRAFAKRGDNGLLSNRQVLNEMRRYADVKMKIKLKDDEFNLSNYYDHPEWLSPFTDMMYKDGAPMIYCNAALALTGNQTQYAAFDAVQMFRYMMADTNDPISFVSSRMPYKDTKSKALAKFIEKYVVACGAGMPVHFYRGRRVELENGVVPAVDDEIYINNFSRVETRWNYEACLTADTKVETLTHYLNDNFLRVGSTSRDPNADYAYIDEAGNGNPYSWSATMPPYHTKSNEDENVLRDGNTYTRVRLQFTFSQRAGRWYTTEYRQYPCSYLTPLYGNDALTQKARSIYDENGNLVDIDNTLPGQNTCLRKIWRNAACTGFDDYRKVMMAPYSSYPPMDITLGCVPYMFNQWPFDNDGKLKPELSNDHDVIAGSTKPRMWLLETPWIKYDDFTDARRSGISLYAPMDVHGDTNYVADAEHSHVEDTTDIHANFWSVREFIRPASSILMGSDVPKYEDPDTYDATTDYRKGGLESDPTLYRMFDYPKAGKTEYHLPNPSDPSEDMIHNYLLYHGLPGNDNRNKEGVFQSHEDDFWIGYGVSDADQNIEE